MKRRAKRYTIRGVPADLDRRLRETAQEREMSLNALVLEYLMRAARLPGEDGRYHDLDHLIGKWQDDPAFDAVLQDQRKIDGEMWT